MFNPISKKESQQNYRMNTLISICIIFMGGAVEISKGWETANLLVGKTGNILAKNDLNIGQYGISAERKHKGHYFIKFAQDIGVIPVVQVTVHGTHGKGMLTNIIKNGFINTSRCYDFQLFSLPF